MVRTHNIRMLHLQVIFHLLAVRNPLITQQTCRLQLIADVLFLKYSLPSIGKHLKKFRAFKHGQLQGICRLSCRLRVLLMQPECLTVVKLNATFKM